MNEIILTLQNQCKRGLLGKMEVRIVCYAHDATLIADSEDDFQRLFFEFHKACKQFYLNVSARNTEELTVNK